MHDTKGAHLVGLVAAQLRDCQTTVSALGWFPPHISRLSAKYTAILLREGAIRLPRDARGVRIRMEMAHTHSLSQSSFGVVCELVRAIDIPPPPRGSSAYRTASAMFRELTAPSSQQGTGPDRNSRWA